MEGKIISTFYFMIFIPQIFRLECSIGCLKCNLNDECIICDTSQGYSLKLNECYMEHKIENCKLIDLYNNCLICEENFIKMETTGECISTLNSLQIENCILFNSSNVCIQCKKEYYLNNTSCLPVETTFKNCEIYLSKDLCQQCEENYYLSDDLKNCLQMSNTCLGFSKYECKQCKNGFILNRNHYFKEIFQFEDQSKISSILDLFHQDLKKISFLTNLVQCEEVIVTNCSQYDFYNECKICDSGYFLTSDKTCQIYPLPVVENCLIYLSSTVCSLCNQGFYLDNPQTCSEIESVDYCLLYYQDSNKNTCKQCNESHYLAGNLCHQRIKSSGTAIENCLEKDQFSDKCKTCLQNHIISQEGLKCFLSVKNCEKHFSTTQNASQIVCSQCNPGFYLEEFECTEGSDQNCFEFELNQDICKKCKPGFYSEDQEICRQHIQIESCQIFSLVERDTCDLCSSNSFNFIIDSKCKNLDQISNCLKYQQIDIQVSKCIQCEEGYFLEENLCVKIEILNCAQIEENDASKCLRCFQNYSLVNKKIEGAFETQCSLNYSYLTLNCEEMNSNPSQYIHQAKCNVCKENTFSLNLENSFVCLEEENINQQNLEIENLIQNCLKMDKQTCVLCKENYFLKQIDNEWICVNNYCGENDQQGTFTPIVLEKNDQNMYFVVKSQVCLEDEGNILIKSPNYFIPNGEITIPDEKIAISCKSDVPTVLNPFQENQNFSIISPQGLNGVWITSVFDNYPEVSCPLVSDVDFINDIESVGDFPLVTNCKYYIYLNSQELGCYRCTFGYHSSVNSNNFLDNCQTFDQCSVETKYQNLDIFYVKQFSCHKCIYSGQIPYSIYKGNAKDDPDFFELTPFTFENPDWTTSQLKMDGKTNLCLSNISHELAIQLSIQNSQNISLVQNCGLGILNLQYSNEEMTTEDISVENQLTEKMGILCAACAPGFYPIQRIGDSKFISECQEIPNCDQVEGNWLNSCAYCLTNYTHSYENNKINYQKCVFCEDLNCYSYDETLNKCVICKKNYFLNKDFICVQQQLQNCEISQFLPFNQLPDPQFVSYAYSKGPGCNQCEDGFISVKVQSNNLPSNPCGFYQFLVDNGSNFQDQQNGTKSNFISNCKNYVNSLSNTSNNNILMKCQECFPDYILRENQEECVSKQSIPHCQIALNFNNSCKICENGYGLINSSCLLGNVENCLVFNQSVSLSKITCQQCNPGFYLTQNFLCSEGFIKFCDEYDHNPLECKKCLNNFFLVKKQQLSSLNSYCYPEEKSLNCKNALIYDSPNGARFNCLECDKPFGIKQLVQENEPKSICIKFNEISNCQIYYVNKSLQKSSFACSQCQNGYFLDHNDFQCLKREQNISNCLNFQLRADLCLECEEKYFLSSNKKECIQYPVGVQGCTEYQNIDTCSNCQQDRYLKFGKCVLITNLIENCKLYQNEETCKQCQDNFYLSYNECLSVNVTNCKIYISVNECQECSLNYMLDTINGVVTCIINQKPNCEILNPDKKEECLYCKQEYYLVDQTCVQAKEPVMDCKYHFEEGKCAQCQPGYSLSIDKTRCIILDLKQDQNCEIFEMNEKLNCTICWAGKYFDGGQCVDFLNNGSVDGCFSSDPVDENICFMCNSGYYMKPDQKCTKILDQVVRIAPLAVRISNIIFTLTFYMCF